MPENQIEQDRISFLVPKISRPDCPLFIFLPGMDGTGQLLHTQTESLEKAFDVRCLKLPRNDLNDWEVLSERVWQLISAEMQRQGQDSVYLCGESFGGCLALRVALRSPELFKKIILINPASSFHRRPWLSWGTEFISWMPEPIYRTSALGLLPFLASLSRIEPDDSKALLNAMKTVPSETAAWRLSMLKDFSLDNLNLKRLTQPVLVIASAADRLLPSVDEAKHLIDNLPNAQMVVLPESGHACLLEKDIFLYKIMKDRKFIKTKLCEDNLSVAA